MGSMPSIPPPPGSSPSPDPTQGATSPTSPMAVSPDPSVSGGPANQTSLATLQIVMATRMIAKQYPQAAPIVREINDLVQQLQMVIGSQMDNGSPAAPPIG